MADPKPSLAERLLAGDKRALARGISLVEDDDAEGWELVRIMTGMALHREKDGHLLLFKRPTS